MVCTDRDPGDFYSVFSRARTAPRSGTVHDAGSRGGNAGMVHEIDAARGRSRLQLRLSPAAEEKVATLFRAHLARRNADYLSATTLQAHLCRGSGGLGRAGASG